MEQQLSQIQQCFQIICTSQDSAMIKQANEYLNQQEKDSSFYKYLIKIFQEEQDINVKFQALNLFKNVLIRNWKLRYVKNDILFSNDQKKDIQNIILDMIQNVFEKRFRNIVDDCLVPLVKVEYPQNYQPLFNFFHQMLKQFQTINLDTDPKADQFIQLLNTFKKVIKENQKRRTNLSLQSFQQYNQKILEELFILWDINSKFYQQQKLFKILNKIDKLIMIQMMTSYQDAYLNEFFILCIQKLFQKLCFLIQMVNQQENQKFQQELEKNIYTLLYNFTNLQESYSLAFQEILPNYIDVSIQILENRDKFKNQKLIKSSIISIIKLMRSSHYNQSMAKFRNPEMQQKQTECIQIFGKYFNEQKIDTLVKALVLNILPQNCQKEQKDFDDDYLINEDEPEIEASQLTLLVLLVEKIFYRFPQLIIPYSNIINQMLQNIDNVNPYIQDAIFTTLGIFPKIYQKLNQFDLLKQNINILQILQLMIQRINKHKVYVQQIPYLTRSWINILDSQTLREISMLVIEMLQQNLDEKIKYDYCYCIYKIILKPEVQLDFSTILEKICPIIVHLLSQDFKPEILWPMIQLLIALISKTQNINSQFLIQQLNSPSFHQLFDQDSQLIRESLADMLKILAQQFKEQNQLIPIYILIFKFIDKCFQKQHYDYVIFQVWLFVTQNYIQNDQLDELYKNLMNKYFTELLTKNDSDLIQIIIFIFEEYMLINFLYPEQVSKIFEFLQQKYNLALQIGKSQDSLVIKEACLNLVASFLLINLNQMQTNQQAQIFQQFFEIIKLIIKEISDLNINKTDHEEISVKSQIMTITNRFIILSPQIFKQVLEHMSIDCQVFIQFWIQNMNFLSTKISLKINAFAILQFLTFFDKQNFINHINQILKYIWPQLIQQDQNQSRGLKKIQNFDQLANAQVKQKDQRISQRKEQLRQTQLYNDVNISQLFELKFKEMIAVYQISIDQLKNIVQDQNILQDLQSMI